MPNSHLLSLALPSGAGDKKHVGNLKGSALSVAIAQLSEQHSGHTLLVVPDPQLALKLTAEVEQFTQQPVHMFPDWETLPYDNFSPHQDIISDRISTLYQLPTQSNGITVIPVSTLLQRQSPRDFLMQHTLMVKNGDRYSLEALRLQLEKSGYRHVDQVFGPGEYASRGSIIDLYPVGSNDPYRIDFFDDEIDSIRTFDPENQRSIDDIPEIRLLPAHEFPTTDQAIEDFRGRWRQKFEARREPESIYMQISKGTWPAGIEYWQPLFFEHTETLFDYLPDNTLLISVGNLENAIDTFLGDVDYRFDQRKIDPLRPLLEPELLWLKKDELFSHFKSLPQSLLSAEEVAKKGGRSNEKIDALPDLHVQHQNKEPMAALRQFVEQFSGKIVFSVESEGRREALLELLQRIKLKPVECTSLNDALAADTKINLILGAAEHGFIYEPSQIALICESDLLGDRVIQRRKKDRKAVNSDTVIRHLAELKPGQPVVHLDHGIGRYTGLQTLEAGGMPTEYVTLEYQDGAKLYVPVSSLNLISRYSGGAEDSAPLHKLGGEAWAKARRRAAEKVRDVAAELLDVYAKRELKPGFKFKLDREEYATFKSTFPFEETDDQATAINSVLSDMCQPKAMDRLVCGDVGFGKTEVAMRAAFVATDNSKQVAVLVPTTLLAQQHFENFRDRFANLPIRVEVLSRFKSAKEQKQILADVEEGKVDIIIGTHKLLQNDIKFKDLGLLIVDEEHRFGVRQKEKVKAMRADVDILTLTATPIPRTLNMAMSGMRDLSIIATPPARRLAIKTFVRQSEDSVTREAVLREIMRGGQVYFLHNQVETIEKVAADLEKLIPEARVTVAHGQMRERELERIMNDFYHQRFNLLVCTTIIETGIDVPTANTIIMDRADNLGLAQLHQLRGRVGRSHHQAYAYLLTPHPKAMTKDAIKRLDAIASLEDLGAGFTLATHDLEIRGAGELLGDEQSGQIQSVGFTLYMEMLEQAVEALKEGKEPSLDELLRDQTEVELRLPALLPDDYIPDINTRLSMYKRIASVSNENELAEMKVELIDRFGTLPDAAKNLLAVSEVKQKAGTMHIKKIEAHAKGGFIEFYPTADINPAFLVKLLQSAPQKYGMEGPTKLKFALPLTDRRERVRFINDLLQQFAENRLPS
ncbi:transcription-repair coupling factor [Vibrio nigripulchritudo SFn27]|uniref:Transcription-repair-coupling factor n=1 Tax=Vibrio nigripulchritudo TaxID=28173 RepID=U4KAF2_9VIBR|nr:transcription-repair coupling factor [Vibrio nigripulchritudo]CCN83710.1 transcription-repair coupling factor [Vibrio nigripulchritudo BLFn1]CCN87284.1 transcription-repair coupling factor [Vibrio nigripulchritudo SFn27]CCN94663.1 transcription-repair coupling factor [Vibrio nigripulchritudo ENn2]CCO40796.1 transcription-repair coupling factor [Vibrio nigripulchritudo SFn135]CCO54874.1 transcription-repair coupling factor [Vibrio nigripulchritudo Wn13]